jgi:hypothetical protein
MKNSKQSPIVTTTDLALAHLFTSGMASELNRITNGSDFVKLTAYLIVYKPSASCTTSVASIVLRLGSDRMPSWKVSGDNEDNVAFIEGFVQDLVSL